MANSKAKLRYYKKGFLEGMAAACDNKNFKKFDASRVAELEFYRNKCIVLEKELWILDRRGVKTTVHE